MTTRRDVLVQFFHELSGVTRPELDALEAVFRKRAGLSGPSSFDDELPTDQAAALLATMRENKAELLAAVAASVRHADPRDFGPRTEEEKRVFNGAFQRSALTAMAQRAALRDDILPHTLQAGQTLWPYSYARHKQDAVAVAALQQYFLRGPGYGQGEGADIAGTMDMFHWAWFSAKWAQTGFPRLQIGHIYAASLMATHADPDVVGDIAPPWPAFCLSVPPGLLAIEPPGGGPLEPVEHLFVMRTRLDHREGDAITLGEELWTTQAYTTFGACIYRHQFPTRELLQGEDRFALPDGADPPEGPWARLDERDERATLLLGRLLMGVCLTATDPAALVKKTRGFLRPPSGPSEEPRCCVFELRPAGELTDCREAVRAYMDGQTRSSPKVRTLVRGHWRMQPHGPGLTLRKPVPIPPYWRGPVQAQGTT